MGPHKHRQKKKYHRHKGDGDLSEDNKNYHRHRKEAIFNEDDIDEFWTVHSSDSDNEDINQGKRLTTLVRKSYVKHLHETLERNYEEWKKTVKDADTTLNIKKWVKVLEQKALRSCMVAELYQKTMIYMISDIKKSTQKSKLHIDGESQKKLSRCLGVDKETQCEIVKKIKTFSVQTQTGKLYTSPLDIPLPNSEPCAVSPVILGQPIPTIDQIRDCVAKVTPVPRSNRSRDQLLSADAPYNPLIVFSPNENSEPIDNLAPPTTDSFASIINKIEQTLTNNIPTMVPPPNIAGKNSVSKTLSYEEKDASLPITPLKYFPITEKSLSEVGNSDELRNDILSDLKLEFSNPDEIQEDNINNIVLNSNSKSDVLADNKNNKPPEVPRSSIQNLYDRKHKRKSSASLSELDISNKTAKHYNDGLDARLTAMGLLDEDIDKDEISIGPKPKKSNWALEFIAQSCNLTRIINRLSQKKRKILAAKFEILFGLPNEPDSELSEENIRICRKRIASAVCAELTPLYQAKRIGSRYLFKFLAKHSTSSLMEKSYAPESRVVRKYIEELFNGNKDVESERDILL